MYNNNQNPKAVFGAAMEIMFQFTPLLIMTHKRGQPVINCKCFFFFHLNAFSKDMKGHNYFMLLLYWLKRDRWWVCVTDKLTENEVPYTRGYSQPPTHTLVHVHSKMLLAKRAYVTVCLLNKSATPKSIDLHKITDFPLFLLFLPVYSDCGESIRNAPYQS